MKTIITFILAAWMAVWPLGANPLLMLAGKPPSAASTVLIDEGFEETDTGGALGSSTDGYDSALVTAETVGGSSTIAPDDTTALIMAGSQQLKVVASGGVGYVRYTLPSTYTDLWIRVRLRGVSSSNRQLFSARDGSNNPVFNFFYAWAPTLDLASGTDAAATDPGGGSYKTIWVHYVTSGTCSVAIANDSGSRPTSGSAVATGTDTSGRSIKYIDIGHNDTSGVTMYADGVKVSTEAFD